MCRCCAKAQLVVLGVCFLGYVTASPAVAEHGLSPGLHDVVIYDAGAHQQGFPGIEFREIEAGLEVDIPPAVHVHRYYYSGDKEIQGPIVAGGPTIVVAKHPKTGQQMYVDAVLPAGTPRISYHKHGITYVYPHERVAIRFQHWPLDPHNAVVKYHKGRGVGRVAQEAHQKSKQHVHESLHESALVKSLKEVTKGAGRLGLGTTEAVVQWTSGGVDLLKTVAGVVPGVSTITSLAEQRPERQYSTSIEQAANQNAIQTTSFFRTNR